MIALVVLFISAANLVSSAHILFIITPPSPSHHLWNRVLALELAENGHNVTFFSPEDDKETTLLNYTHHRFEGVYEGMAQNFVLNDIGFNTPFEQLAVFRRWCTIQCEYTVQSPQFQNLLHSSATVDLIIIDVSCGPCPYPLIHSFNYPPTIGVTSLVLPAFVSYSFGNPLFPSFQPLFLLPYTPDMSLIERLWNYICTYTDIFLRYQQLYANQYTIVNNHFKLNLPTMVDLERHISLVLANTDPILDYPQSLPPNIIPVGGLHTAKPRPLPEEYHAILDNCESGVIVFSLGTNIRSDRLEKKVRNELLNAFSRLNETVIWKFETELTNLPKNVIIRKWLPQNILEHPKIKLFIGHGGALSTQEAMYYGVPIITIPYLIDQFQISKNIIRKKIGTTIENTKLEEEYILKKLQEVLGNKMYKKNVMKLSAAFRDRPETPLKRAIFWIEYILRNTNGDNLSLASRNMPFYKSSELDILIIVVTLLFVIISILYNLLNLISLFGKK